MNFWVFNNINLNLNILSEVKNFSNIASWATLVQMFFIFIALVLGNLLRRKIPFIRKSLIPAAILAGAIILIFKAIAQYVFHWDNLIDASIMEDITYHCLGLGFIALALKITNKDERASTITIVETGAMTVGGYIIQGIVGLIASFIIFYVLKYGISNWGWAQNAYKWFAGLLLPLGFGQGTGQALSWGLTYQNDYGFFGGDSFGLSIATIGFVVASVVGVIYLNILRKKGKISNEIVEHKDHNTLADYETKNDIPNTESIDKLTVQISFVLSVYAITFGVLYGIQKGLIDTGILGNFGVKTLSPLLWGFNFLFGTLFALLFKTVIKGMKKTKFMTRNYTNNYLLDRIGGLFFDVMIVAGTAAINFEDMKTLYGPLIILCVCGTIVTFIFIRLATKVVYKGYENEGFFAMFGMLTGTASNGMILLRELDPKYETPMANNLVFQNLPAIILGFPFLLLLGFAAKSELNGLITLIILILYFTAIVLFLFRSKIFKKKQKKIIETKE